MTVDTQGVKKIILAGAVLVVCSLTLIGLQQALAHGWKAPEAAANKKNPVKMAGGSIAAGRAVYEEF